MDNILGMIGLAKRAGSLAEGEETVRICVTDRKAKIVMTASDASDGTLRRVRYFTEAGAVRHIPLPYTKAELGNIASRGGGLAILAITDIGMASEIVGRLNEKYGGAYNEAAEELGAKAAKAAMLAKQHKVHESRKRRHREDKV